MHSPLDEIEDAKAHFDIGTTAFRIYSGARAGGAKRIDACTIVYAWFLAMFDQAQEDDEE